MTGAFFSDLDGRFTRDGWTVDLSFVEFSKVVKEPIAGADVAIVLDAVNNHGKRSFKSIWVQAKSQEAKPTISTKLPRLDEQLSKARQFCSAVFGLVYSQAGVYVVEGSNSQPSKFSNLISNALRCHSGDMELSALTNSLNRKKLLHISLTEA